MTDWQRGFIMGMSAGWLGMGLAWLIVHFA